MYGIQVLYEDNHLIGVNKPAGWLVHEDVTEDKPLSEFVKEYIKIRYKKPGAVFLGVIHRLDRPVSGAMIFARTSKGLSRMNALFKNREVKKVYWAVTKERPKPISGELVHYVLKDTEKNIAKAYDQPSNRAKNAKKAVLEYELIAQMDGYCLTKIMLKTGRPHQIRVQMAKIGCPIVGDVKYGFKQGNRDGSIHLHCRSLEFIHPVKNEKVYFEADPPDDPLWKQFAEVVVD
jgi:23S rRNA pseudouridine1911/1915/1917 synthase